MALVPKGGLRPPSSRLKAPALKINNPRQFSTRVPFPQAAAPPARAPPVPIATLRSLARSLFSTTSKRFFTSPPVKPHPWLPADLSSRVRLHGKPQFHWSAPKFNAGGFRGPMGPGVKNGFRAGGAIAQVGLGTSRGYATAARPLFENLIGNAPLVLRALGNSLEDEAEKLSKHRSQRKPVHFNKKKSSASHHKSSLKQSPPKKVQKASVVAVPEEEELTPEEAYEAFFGASAEHVLPAPRSVGTTTTLLIPFSIDASVVPDTSSLSRLASSHRASYRAHALKVDRFMCAMCDRGVFLDGNVWEETIVDAWGDILGIKLVWRNRSEEEVRRILKHDGEDAWWFLTSFDDRSGVQFTLGGSLVPPAPSFVFPSLSFSSSASLDLNSRSGSPLGPPSIGGGLSNVSSGISFSSGFLTQLSESDLESLDEWSDSDSVSSSLS